MWPMRQIRRNILRNHIRLKQEFTICHRSKVSLTGAEAQQRIVYPVGTIKIKVPADAFVYLKEARRIEFEGRRYSIVSDYKPFGIFGPKYYAFILSPIDE